MLRTSLKARAVVEGAIKNNAGVLTLNRPKALNSLDLEMVNLMTNQLNSWMRPNPQIKLLIQNSSSPKAFCAGGDVRAITDAGKNGNTQLGKDFFATEYKLDYKLATLPVPVVSLIHGIVMGGGVGISLHGNFRVATEKTMFAMPETGIGLVPDVGGGYFLPRLEGELGAFLGLTGYRLKSVDNLHAGIATHICSVERLEALTEALTNSTGEIENIESILLEFQENSLRENTDLNLKFSLADHLETINECFKFNLIAEINQALSDNGSEFALKQLKTIGRMSPTSLAVTLEQIRRGANLSLKEVLNMEHSICSECMEQKDFYWDKVIT